MKRTKVESSNIAAVGYDKEQQILEIEFNSKAVYQYFDVDSNVFDELMAAESHGRYFNAHIKHVYSYKKVTKKAS